MNCFKQGSDRLSASQFKLLLPGDLVFDKSTLMIVFARSGESAAPERGALASAISANHSQSTGVSKRDLIAATTHFKVVRAE